MATQRTINRPTVQPGAR